MTDIRRHRRRVRPTNVLAAVFRIEKLVRPSCHCAHELPAPAHFPTANPTGRRCANSFAQRRCWQDLEIELHWNHCVSWTATATIGGETGSNFYLAARPCWQSSGHSTSIRYALRRRGRPHRRQPRPPASRVLSARHNIAASVIRNRDGRHLSTNAGVARGARRRTEAK